VASDVGDEWVITHTTNERLNSFEQTYDFIFDSRTEIEHLKATKIKINNTVCWDIESDFVIATEVE
jgi:hypothetical protein